MQYKHSIAWSEIDATTQFLLVNIIPILIKAKVCEVLKTLLYQRYKAIYLPISCDNDTL